MHVLSTVVPDLKKRETVCVSRDPRAGACRLIPYPRRSYPPGARACVSLPHGRVESRVCCALSCEHESANHAPGQLRRAAAHGGACRHSVQMGPVNSRCHSVLKLDVIMGLITRTPGAFYLVLAAAACATSAVVWHVVVFELCT